MPAPRAIVSTTPGGSGAPLGSRLVISPVGTPPLRTFREVLYLRLTAGGLAEEIALDPAATVLRARFEPLEYDALKPGAPMAPANVRAVDGALVVELDAPRRLLFVKLAPQKLPASDFTLLVHRLDGQAIAEKPTVTAAQSPAQTFHFDFTDARFALRLRDSKGQSVSLATADVLAVNVQADPAGTRLGIAPLPDPAQPGVDPLAAPALFWPGPGDAAPTVEVDAGPALAETLERQLARLTTLPAGVDVALVIAADAPCRIVLQALDLPYRLVRLSLGSGTGKEVVRFAGGAADRPLLLQLPGGAKVTSAMLETLPSLRVDRPVSGGAEMAAEEPAEQTGVRVDGRAWIAQRSTPLEAVSVLGIAVGLLGLTQGTELTLELREDHQGEPTGRTVAAGSLTLGPAGRRAWSTVFLRAPVILPAQPCWLLLTAAGGEAVWLARSGETGVRILDRSESPSARKAGVEGLEALHRLLIAEARQTETSETTPTLELRLGGSPVPEVAGGESDRKSFDLAGALTRYLAGRPATSPQDVPLDFTSAVPGSLTVYPPRITYEPG